ncbi:MAG: hypothetical protein GX897_04480 [Clostridiales bacterium]|nr:hypothetical protein [Clostridiales bacterium]
MAVEIVVCWKHILFLSVYITGQRLFRIIAKPPQPANAAIIKTIKNNISDKLILPKAKSTSEKTPIMTEPSSGDIFPKEIFANNRGAVIHLPKAKSTSEKT